MANAFGRSRFLQPQSFPLLSPPSFPLKISLIPLLKRFVQTAVPQMARNFPSPFLGRSPTKLFRDLQALLNSIPSPILLWPHSVAINKHGNRRVEATERAKPSTLHPTPPAYNRICCNITTRTTLRRLHSYALLDKCCTGEAAGPRAWGVRRERLLFLLCILHVCLGQPTRWAGNLTPREKFKNKKSLDSSQR